MRILIAAFKILLLIPMALMGLAALFLLIMFLDYKLYTPYKDKIANLPNETRECSKPADPVRVMFHDTLLTIPGNYLISMHSSCRGWGTNCKLPPRRKKFDSGGAGDEHLGYCQDKNGKPFIAWAGIELDLPEKIPLHLTAKNRPSKTHYLSRIQIRPTARYSSSSFCKEKSNNLVDNAADNNISGKMPGAGMVYKANPDFTQTRYEPAKLNSIFNIDSYFYSGITNKNATLFDNPVQIICKYTDENGKAFTKGNPCNFMGYINKDIYMVNGYFKDSDIPPEYWTSYVKELERFLSSLIPNEQDHRQPFHCPDNSQ